MDGGALHGRLDDEALARLYREHVHTVAARHDRALRRAGAAYAVIFSGAPRLRFLDDSHVPFRPNPHFAGWVPLTEHPLCYIVYTPGERPLLVYYQPKDYWHAPPAAPEGFWTASFDIRVIRELSEIGAHLPLARDKGILIGEIDDRTHACGIDRINPSSAMNILHYARATKTPYEMECLRAACRLAVRGHRAAESAFRAGASEFDIHFAYCRAVGRSDVELPYDSIVALNEHGAILHYQHRSRTPPDAIRSFLIDAGTSVNGYASDITRTYAQESGDFAALIDRMDALQQEVVAEIRAGVDYAALHVGTHEKIAALLVDVGFASGTAEALISNGVTSAFYPHGLGHLLGLQVHDVGGFMADENGATIDRPPGHPFLRLTRRLEADQVLTVEPGLYFIDMLLEDLQGTPGHAMLNPDEIDRFRPFGGIRIEDDVRVLDDGCENLTRDAFATA